MSASKARTLIKRNAELIDSQADPVAWNTNAALLELCDTIDNIHRDLGLLLTRVDLIKTQVCEDPKNSRWRRPGE